MRADVDALLAAVLLSGISGVSGGKVEEGNPTGSLSTLEQITEIAEGNQKLFWQLLPPSSEDVVYIHPEKTVRVVDWGSGEWPRDLLKYMYAEMGTATSGATYPFYRLTVLEEDGSFVFYNAYDQEVSRIPLGREYNPYHFALEHFGVHSEEELTKEQKQWGRSSNVGTTMLLLPNTFAASYAQETADSMEVAAFSADTLFAGTGTMTALSVPLPPDSGTTGGGTSSNLNLRVTMRLPLEEGFGPYLVLYGKENLIYDDWELIDDWIPTYGLDELAWEDAASSNKGCFFYQYFPATDTNMDGISDIVAERNGSAWTNSFCTVDSDGDGLLDVWEMKLFGSLSQDAEDDFDGEGLLNGEELVWNINNNTVVMYSDPGLADSDGDGLDDRDEINYKTKRMGADSDGDSISDGTEVLVNRTDPNNPDITAPTISFN